jgi:ferric-dicitrate binding protein FerR (iron transport regulator)
MAEKSKKIIAWNYLSPEEREASALNGSVLGSLAIERARTETYWRERLVAENKTKLEKIIEALQRYDAIPARDLYPYPPLGDFISLTELLEALSEGQQ